MTASGSVHTETSPPTRRRRRETSRLQQARVSSPTAARPRPPTCGAPPGRPAAALPYSPARQRLSVTAARVSRALRAVAPPSLTRCTRTPVPGDEADAVLSSSGSDDDGFGRGLGSEPRRGRDDAGGDGRKRACAHVLAPSGKRARLRGRAGLRRRLARRAQVQGVDWAWVAAHARVRDGTRRIGGARLPVGIAHGPVLPAVTRCLHLSANETTTLAHLCATHGS